MTSGLEGRSRELPSACRVLVRRAAKLRSLARCARESKVARRVEVHLCVLLFKLLLLLALLLPLFWYHCCYM